MKRYFVLAVLVIMSSNLFAQNLTKDQTITYILEKLKETENLRRTQDAENKFTHFNIQFKKSPTNPNRIIFQYQRNFEDKCKDKIKFEFFPQYIKSVEKYSATTGDAVAYLVVRFTGRNAVYESTDEDQQVIKVAANSMLIPYLIADALHYERISKALLHLRDVTIASMAPDPFVP